MVNYQLTQGCTYCKVSDDLDMWWLYESCFYSINCHNGWDMHSVFNSEAMRQNPPQLKKFQVTVSAEKMKESILGPVKVLSSLIAFPMTTACYEDVFKLTFLSAKKNGWTRLHFCFSIKPNQNDHRKNIDSWDIIILLLNMSHTGHLDPKL